VLKPAATAHKRVTVNSAAGSISISRSRLGELVVDLPADAKLVLVPMEPSGIPCVLTLERTPVIVNPAVKRFISATETRAMLFSCPVVGNTRQVVNQRLWISLDDSPVSAALERRSVFRPGSVTFRLIVSNACSKGAIFVLSL
jgi:hypothetical protein